MREMQVTCFSEARSLSCGWRCGSGMWGQEGQRQVLQEHLLLPGRSQDPRRAPAQHPSVHVPLQGRLRCSAVRPALHGTVALASGCLLAPCPFPSSWTPKGMTSTEAGCILLLQTASPHGGSKRSSSEQSPPFWNGLSLKDVFYIPTLSLSCPHQERPPYPKPASARPSPTASFSEVPSPAHTQVTAPYLVPC